MLRRSILTFALLVLVAAPARAETLAELTRRFRGEKKQPYAVRILTVQAIAALDDEKAAQFLLRVVVEDEDQSIRLNTIHQVARMPHRVVFDTLLRLVRTGDSSLRSTAFHAIVYNRKEALPEDLLAEILAGTDQGMRANVIRYLAGREDPRFVPETERFLASFPNGSSSLTSLLVQVKTADAARFLVRIYDDTRSYDRGQVPPVFAGEDAALVPILVEALEQGPRPRRRNAAILAARAHAGAAEEALAAAVSGATVGGDAELHAILVEAIGAVGAATHAGRQAVVAALGHDDPDRQVAGVRAARDARLAGAIEPLIVLLASEDRVVAAESAVTLERITGQQYGSRADLWERWWREFGATFDPATVEPRADDVLPQVLVDLAIERGAAALRGCRGEKPPWSYASHGAGTTALVLLALQAAGAGARDRDVKAAVDWLRKAPTPDRTYEVGLVAMALEKLTGKRYRRKIAECARFLIAHQKAEGLWGYPTGDGDNSNTQYAVLGLRSAARAGVRIPQRVWERVVEHFAATTGPDGGWAYTVRNRTHSSSSMTSAGVCCLLIALENLKAPDDARRVEILALIEKGYEALGALMKLDKDTLYTLYGIERAGVLGARSTMGGHPWYRPGATRLVEEQGRDGFWTGNYAPAVDTAFAILFLKRATVPIAGPTTR